MIGRKPIISADSPEQGESIQRNYVIFDVSAQEGSPTLKRSGKGGELTDWRRYGAPFALWLLAQKILLGRIWRGGELPNRRPSIRGLSPVGGAVVHGALLLAFGGGMQDFSSRPALVIDQVGVWLYVDGARVCDLDDMAVYDFGQRLTIEGGLVFEVLPPEWRPLLQQLGLL